MTAIHTTLAISHRSTMITQRRPSIVGWPLHLPHVALFLIGACALPMPLAGLDIPDLAKYPGAEAGLVLIVDPADTGDAVRLARQQRYLVATLEDDLRAVTAQNTALATAGVYPVAQCHPWWFPQRLPFRTNGVDVVVLRQGLDAKLVEEAQRVIAPGTGLVLVEKDGAWQELRKPRPKEMATWLGYAADGSNSFVSHDHLLGEVNSVQFFHGGNRAKRLHPYVADDRVMIQAVGSIEGRNAFSGSLRWHSKIEGIQDNIGSTYFIGGDYFWWLYWTKQGGQLRSVHRLTGIERKPLDIGPTVQFRGQDNDAMSRMYRAVSDGTSVYATGGNQSLMAFDVVSGNQLWRTEFPEFVECVAVSSGLLVAQLSSTGNSPREAGFGWNCNVAAAVVGIDPATGKVLWRNEDAKGKPTHNLVIDAEKVVVCSFLPHGGIPEKRADVEWYKANLYLHVIERDTGKTRVFRTDFSDVLCNNSIQVAGTWPGRIGVMKDNNMTTFDAKTGATIHNYQGPGYHLCVPAASPKHFWTGNAAIPLDDPEQMVTIGHDMINPAYYYRNAIANGMLYTPSRFGTVNSTTTLGSAGAMIHRSAADQQLVPWTDARRAMVAGNATWSAPAPADWPTLRGDFERSGWLSGTGVVPTRLAWEVRPATAITQDAAQLLREGWRDNGHVAGIISHPVVQGNRLVVTIPDEHRVLCYDRAKGTELWSLRLDGRMDTSPTLAGGTGYVGTDDGMVTAIDLADGRVVWRFFAGPGADLVLDHDQVSSLYRVPSAPVLLDGALFVSAGRHAQLELGTAIWKLDPATGKVLGRTVLDEAWVGPDTRPRFRKIGIGGGPVHRSRALANDVMQVRRGQLCMLKAMIDPKTMETSFYEPEANLQEIQPLRGGIGGGTTWVRPFDQTTFYHLEGSHGSTGQAFGMILNRVLGRFAMAETQGKITVVPLGFATAENRGAALRGSATNASIARSANPNTFAARGDRLYHATAHWGDKKLHLVVMDHREPDKTLADIAITPISPDEEIIPDGIAIMEDMVILVTSHGRILAFDAGQP
ncbi:MAG: Serine/threonine-protein kinase AfsK [Planctomycetota bacterium]|jgi:outer membrane protein assembly factor BamB